MKIGDTQGEIEVADGRVVITANSDVGLYLQVPPQRPLLTDQTHATITISGSDARAEFELDSETLDNLVEHLQRLKDGEL